MTPNKRIFLNIVATYGRSLYALVCGLFTSRWALMSLGTVDYGLYGVVGGLLTFVGFVNGLLSFSVVRFYAFAVGEAKNATSPEDGIEECRKWFNTALMLHSLVPIVLVAIGYPCGEWAVRNFLTIPSDRVEMCVWVWRFACLSGLLCMVNVPFQAMYTAKQEIAELTIYSVISTTANVVFLGYMVTHPGVWLSRYAFGAMLIAVIPQLVICIMAFRSFKECRVRMQYLFNWERTKQILMYAGCQFIRATSQVAATQGVAIIVNKMLGPIRNAALAIGNTVSRRTSEFSLAISSAFYPAITNAAGEGDFEKMRCLAFRVSLFQPLVALAFTIPLVLEIDEILRIWLNVPPQGVASFCVCVLAANVIKFTTEGCWMSVHALGRIGGLESVGSVCDFMAFVLAFALIILGCDILSVGLASVASVLLLDCVHLWYGRKIGGLSIRRWLLSVLFPFCSVATVVFAVGCFVRSTFEPSLVRVVLTTSSVESVYLPLVWFFVLKREERQYLIRRVSAKMKWKRDG